MTLRSLALLLAAAALTPALHAQPADHGAAWTPTGQTACRFSGWTTNDKPAIPVRAAASYSAKQIGALPTTRGDSPDPEVDLYSVTFDVTEARDGWLRIRNASDAMSGSDRHPPRPVSEGEGWIAAAACAHRPKPPATCDRSTGNPRYRRSSGQTSTTPCATAQGVRDTFSMASAISAASMTAKPAIGSGAFMNGPFAVATPDASGLRT